MSNDMREALSSLASELLSPMTWAEGVVLAAFIFMVAIVVG